MLKLYDFSCEHCGHEFEEFVETDDRILKCANCGEDAHRCLSAPMLGFIKMGLSPDFPTAYAKWGRSQEYRAKHDKGSLNSTDKAPTLKEY